MATALYVAERALRLILVQASDAPLEADEYQDFYDAMNDFMAGLEADGVKLGYTPVTGPASMVTIPSGALRGLIACMAVEVAPDYEASVTPALARQASRGMRTLLRIGRKTVQVSYPPTLPMGSGNYETTYNDQAFYNDHVNGLLTLTNNARETQIAAANTPVKVDGYWSTVVAMGVMADITGRFRNSGRKAMDVDVLVILEVTGGVGVTVHLYENGNESLSSVTGTADGSILTMRATTELKPNEYLELWIENDDDTSNIVVRDCQFQVT